ncbi:hypothetical protein BLNAU_5405 [Blattamonas nauphoetae]|uniref:Uncharacterized protein n=1 Tax=Blattamonas nauphoetae TaxID=2049346 RepID=A0ABQ9Y787_9EUKA|nr:hypothetical protein BLNAU_5405 [Blattamonas nauphoetae]
MMVLLILTLGDVIFPTDMFTPKIKTQSSFTDIVSSAASLYRYVQSSFVSLIEREDGVLLMHLSGMPKNVRFMIQPGSFMHLVDSKSLKQSSSHISDENISSLFNNSKLNHISINVPKMELYLHFEKQSKSYVFTVCLSETQTSKETPDAATNPQSSTDTTQPETESFGEDFLTLLSRGYPVRFGELGEDQHKRNQSLSSLLLSVLMGDYDLTNHILHLSHINEDCTIHSLVTSVDSTIPPQFSSQSHLEQHLSSLLHSCIVSIASATTLSSPLFVLMEHSKVRNTTIQTPISFSYFQPLPWILLSLAEPQHWSIATSDAIAFSIHAFFAQNRHKTDHKNLDDSKSVLQPFSTSSLSSAELFSPQSQPIVFGLVAESIISSQTLIQQTLDAINALTMNHTSSSDQKTSVDEETVNSLIQTSKSENDPNALMIEKIDVESKTAIICIPSVFGSASKKSKKRVQNGQIVINVQRQLGSLPAASETARNKDGKSSKSPLVIDSVVNEEKLYGTLSVTFDCTRTALQNAHMYYEFGQMIRNPEHAKKLQ